jgi:hypothetical protein
MGMQQALNRHAERVFDPSRKDHHWGRRKFGERPMTDKLNITASILTASPGLSAWYLNARIVPTAPAGRQTGSRRRIGSIRRSIGSRRRSRKSLSGRQLFERELGNFRWIFNPQPANRNDLLGDKLRDGVAAIRRSWR